MNLYDNLLSIAIVFTVPGVTWFLMKKLTNGIINEITKIKEKQSILRESLPIDYVRYEKYSDDVREIKNMLSKIFERLEKKVDKDN